MKIRGRIITQGAVLFALILTLQSARAAEADKNPSAAAGDKKPAPADGDKKADAPEADGEKKTDAPPATASPKPTPQPTAKATPMPRRILLPGLELKTSTSSNPFVVDASANRLTLVVVLGTWNRRSLDVAEVLNSKVAHLESRAIGVVGAFSHDTSVALENWKKVARPRFVTGLVNRSFTETLGNPKVPTMWVVNARNEILTRVELPSDSAIAELFSMLELWTDF